MKIRNKNWESLEKHRKFPGSGSLQLRGGRLRSMLRTTAGCWVKPVDSLSKNGGFTNRNAKQFALLHDFTNEHVEMVGTGEIDVNIITISQMIQERIRTYIRNRDLGLNQPIYFRDLTYKHDEGIAKD